MNTPANSADLVEVNGSQFPKHNGEALSWSIGLYDTANEQNVGYPKMRTVIHAMIKHRPAQLQNEMNQLVKGSFDRVFGHVAKQQLNICRETQQQANGQFQDVGTDRFELWQKPEMSE